MSRGVSLIACAWVAIIVGTQLRWRPAALAATVMLGGVFTSVLAVIGIEFALHGAPPTSAGVPSWLMPFVQQGVAASLPISFAFAVGVWAMRRWKSPTQR